MPRNVSERERVPLADTYPALLRRCLSDQGYDFARLGGRARTLPELVRELENEKEQYEPDYIVIHAGIVDCAPRVFSRWQRKVVRRLGMFRGPLLRFTHRHRRAIIRALPRRVYTSACTYRTAVRSATRIASEIGSGIVFIGIAPSRYETEHRSPGLEENIRVYDDILREECKASNAVFIDAFAVFSDIEQCILSDGIHISSEAHRRLAASLQDVLRKKSVP